MHTAECPVSAIKYKVEALLVPSVCIAGTWDVFGNCTGHTSAVDLLSVSMTGKVPTPA